MKDYKLRDNVVSVTDSLKPWVKTFVIKQTPAMLTTGQAIIRKLAADVPEIKIVKET